MRHDLLPRGVFLLSLGVVLLGPASAADRTWSGAGPDANWNTGLNWGGMVPSNNDNLIFSGALRANNSNNLTGLTMGWLQFANGGFTLGGNALTLNPSSSGLLTNLGGINVVANNLTITPAAKIWSIAAGSEVQLTGVVTNTSPSGTSAGWVLLQSGGALRIKGEARSLRGLDLISGRVIVDGGFVDAANDGIRFKPQASTTTSVILTNNGTIRIGGGGNFRLGHNGTAAGPAGAAGGMANASVSSGLLELSGANTSIQLGDLVAGLIATFTQDGGVVWGSAGSGNTLTLGNAAGASGTYHLNGGLLHIAQIRQGSPSATTATFNFNGGTLKPTMSSPSFFQDVQTANVQNGGAIIDTTNLSITIAQNLQAAGSGGLTKLGSGTLTLAGVNSYVGATIVSNGTLLVTGQLAGGGAVQVLAGALGGTGSLAGPVTVQRHAQLAPGMGVGTLTIQNQLMLWGDLALDVNKMLAVSNDVVQVSGPLTNAGTGTIFLNNLGPALAAGDQFQFFNQPLPNGAALTIMPATPGTGLAWTNRLAWDGTIGVVAVAVSPAANLAALSLSSGTLVPAFAPTQYEYTVLLPYATSAITLTPVSVTNTASLRLSANGVTHVIATGLPTAPIALQPGTNLIVLSVVAADQAQTNDYVLRITRTRPNVVVVLADDQGFTDWGCYGSEIATPTLDRLAQGGLRYRQFYNTARCSTTRCSLLTGLYSHQVASDPSQALPNLRNDNNVTIAELLQANGYRTYVAGKWHLGGGALFPEARGFEQVWRFASGTSHSEDNWNVNRYTLVSSNGEITNRAYATGQFYQSDALGDYAVDFVNHNFVTHADGKPLFLFLSFGAAHFPIQAPPSWVNSNAPSYHVGWEAIRNLRFTKALALGAIDGRHQLSPHEGTGAWNNLPAEAIPPWASLPADRQADLARRMGAYAAMVQKFDANIGRVVARLRELGELDNTIIFVLSDNGGCHEGAVFGQTGGVPNAPPLTGAALTNLGLSGEPVIFLGGGWANVNNTPFRLSKHFNHEGGIRTPLIVHWPQGVARTNQWSDQVGHLIDILPTIVDVAGVSYPTQFNGRTVLSLEGRSLRPDFSATNVVARQLGFEHESNRAWREGDWKLVTKNFTSYSGSPTANELELYHLATDPVEVTNLAAAYPTLLRQMVTNWNEWATRVGVPAARLIHLASGPTGVTPAPQASDLFVDTFNRPNQTDVDASTTGMWGARVPPLGVNLAYFEGYEGSGQASSIQVLSSNLQMAVGAGMSETGIRHNFIGPDIVSAGGFSVSLDVQAIVSDASDAANRYVGFGVGLSAAEAATGWDIFNAPAGPAVSFRGSLTGNLGAADFFVELDLNGNVKVWRKGVLLDTVPVGANNGTLTASFALTGFSTNDVVTVTVYFNGRLVDINSAEANSVSRTFQWERNDSNYLGLSARASNYAQMDNLVVRKLPVAPGLALARALRSGLSGPESDPQADPDGDGVSNWGEWAFGGDPGVADPSIAKLAGLLITPTQDFQFGLQRLINAAAYGLHYQYLISTNLQTWTPTTPTFVSATPNEDQPDYEIVTLRLPAATLAQEPRLFLRVRAAPSP